MTLGDILSGIDAFKRRMVNMPGLQDQREFGADPPDTVDGLQRVLAQQGDDSTTTLGALSGVQAAAPLLLRSGLFDLSKLADLPTYLKDSAFARLPAPAKGIPDYVQAKIANMGNTLTPLAQKAIEPGMAWYNQQPLHDVFMDVLGPDVGAQRWNDWNQLVGATSPANKVTQNQKQASYYFAKQAQGEMGAGLSHDPTGHMAIEPGYAHMYQSDVNDKLARIMNDGGLSTLEDPKTASYADNLAGNYSPVTIDRHFVRGMDLTNKSGKPLEAPKKEWYSAIEDAAKDQASKLGLTPAQYQAAAWIGGAEQTGVANAEPFMALLQHQLMTSAGKTGKTPVQFLQDFVRGQDYIR